MKLIRTKSYDRTPFTATPFTAGALVRAGPAALRLPDQALYGQEWYRSDGDREAFARLGITSHQELEATG